MGAIRSRMLFWRSRQPSACLLLYNSKMFSEFVGGFLGALGGVGVGAAALRFLASKLIEHRLTIALAEHQHGLDKQLETVKTQMDRPSDILSRRNEREFQVTEGAWERVIQAVGTAQSELGQGKRIPSFMMMNEAEAAVAIAALPFTDGEKDQLRRAGENERDAIFRTIDFRNGVYASLRQWRELKNWVATHEIFLNSSVLQLIRALRDDLYGTLVHAQTYAEDGEEMPLLERVEMDRKLARDFNERIDELAEKIRSRFGFAEN